MWRQAIQTVFGDASPRSQIWQDKSSTLDNRRVARPSFAWAGSLTSAIIAKHPCAPSQTPNPILRDNNPQIGQLRDVSIHQDAPRSCPKPFSALFDKLSPYFGIF